jgi:urea transporter
MSEMIFRFLVGGIVVSFFAVLGDVLRPKSFAGLFGAAPSIALATLGLMVYKHGNQYAALESRSMIIGACAFSAYAAAVSFTLRRFSAPTLIITLALVPIWFVMIASLYKLTA